jgi:glyceraldehyde-3-phosphate dehydrogenase type I
MKTKVAINGFGRIGRCVLRCFLENKDLYKNIDIALINATTDLKSSLHLLKYDSIFGTLKNDIQIDGNSLIIDGHKINFISDRDPKNIDWSGIDVVMECTGKFTSTEQCNVHLERGAKKVIISAPSKDKETPTFVYKVNHHEMKKDMNIISIGSCTTNALAPIVKVLDEKFGIQKGFMTTIHSYTGDQNLVDGSHKDLRRARSAPMSMVPTSTGAAKALSLVLPNMAGKLDGSAIRVPTADVSMVDLVIFTDKQTNSDEVNAVLREASNGDMKGVLGYIDEPLVSIDMVKNSHSTIVDSLETKVVGGNCIRIASWYDNEWGFSMRMLDVASLM